MVRLLISLRTTLRSHTAARLGSGWLIAAALLGLVSAAGTLGLAVASYRVPGAGVDVTAFVLALWVGGRILASAVAGGSTELQPALLAQLPVPARRLGFALLAAELLDPATAVLGVVLASGAVLGFRTGFAAGLVGVAAALLTTVLTTVLALAAGGLLGPASRRGRDAGTLVTAVGLSAVACAGALLPLLKSALVTRSSPTLGHLVRSLPSGWGPAAVEAAGRGSWGFVVLALGGLTVLSGSATLCWPSVLRRRMAGGAPRTHVVRRTRLGFLPTTPCGAVAAKELRLWVRDPLRLTCLAVAFLVGLGVCTLPDVAAGNATLLPFTGVLTVLIAGALACNCYGFDGAALWLGIVTPASRAADVRGRQLAWLLLVGPYALLATLVPTAVSGQRWAWPWVLSGLLALIGEGLGLLAWGSLVAVQPLDASGGPTPAWSLKVHAALIVMAVGALPALAPLLAGQLVGSGLLRWLALPVAAVAGGATALLSGRHAAARLARDEVEILAALVTGSG